MAGHPGEVRVANERIEVISSNNDQKRCIYDNEGRRSPLDSSDEFEMELANRFDHEQSILAQLAAYSRYVSDSGLSGSITNDLFVLSDFFKKIRIYRDWCFGRHSQFRNPRRSDLKGDSLSEDLGNLGLVLNRLKRDPVIKNRLLGSLSDLYSGFTGIEIDLVGGMVQFYLEEGHFPVPATRLSDGTLRYLSLFAILCHPKPPPLVCIEEPELGLHPDALLAIAKLIEEASERMQLVITTHSQFLVDYFTHDPEAVVVCEKGDGGTTMRRLDSKELAVWLKEYSLGDLWSRGQIGGNRW